MELVANSVTKNTILLSFLSLSSTAHEIREKIFLGVKFECQIRGNVVPPNSKNSKSAKLNCRGENFIPHGMAISLKVGIVNVFVYQVI